MGFLNDDALGSSPDMEKFPCDLLLDSTHPISDRFRALFSLRNLKGPGPRNALILTTWDSSNWLANEAAFALSQMQNVEAIPTLVSIDSSTSPVTGPISQVEPNTEALAQKEEPEKREKRERKKPSWLSDYHA